MIWRKRYRAGKSQKSAKPKSNTENYFFKRRHNGLVALFFDILVTLSAIFGYSLRCFIGFVWAYASPNISSISNTESISRSRVLADSLPEKFVFWMSMPISFCISISLSNNALFSLLLKKSRPFNSKSLLATYPHLCRNRPSKIKAWAMLFKTAPF